MYNDLPAFDNQVLMALISSDSFAKRDPLSNFDAPLLLNIYQLHFEINRNLVSQLCHIYILLALQNPISKYIHRCLRTLLNRFRP